MIDPNHKKIIDKAEENQVAGDCLLSNCYTNASVHCYYYSVFQYCMIYLSDKVSIPIAYNQQERQAKRNKLGPHEFVIQEVSLCFSNPQIGANFSKNMFSLKKIRIQADYKCLKLTNGEANNASILSKELIESLKKEFGDYV